MSSLLHAIFSRDMSITMYDNVFDMRGSRKFCQKGSNSDNVFFFLMRGERIQIGIKEGNHRPPAKRHYPWWADEGPTLNAGLVAL